MQGLFGIVHVPARGAIDPHTIRAAVDSLQAPPTYEEILWSAADGQACLGRLGLSTMAPQPAIGRRQDLTCLLDGEYLVRSGPHASEEYRRSPELLLQLYEQHGGDLAARLQGWFAILVHDPGRGVLHLWNDRFAHRPLHLYHDAERLVLAPTTRMATRLGGIDTSLDPLALAQFFRYQHLLEDCSLYREFRVLPAGSHVEFGLETGNLHQETYWDLNRLQLDREIPYETAVEEATRLFVQACNRARSGHHRFGTFLSGGLDSRMILAALGEESRGFPTLNYGVRRGGDVVFAQQTAETVGADYHHLGSEYVRDTRSFCEDFFRFSYTPLHYFNGGNITINEQAAQYMDMNLSGLCGESILGDFFSNAPFSLPVVDHESMLDANENLYGSARYNPGPIDWETGALVFTPEFHSLLGDRARESMRRVANSMTCALNRRLELVYMVTRGLRCIGGLLHLDRTRFESRPLYYDYDFFDFAMEMPQPYRTDRRLQISMLNRLSPRLSRIPTAVTGLPPLEEAAAIRAAARRNRVRYHLNRLVPFVAPVPTTELSAWPHTMRTETVHWAGDYLLGSDSRLQVHLREEYVRSLLRRVATDKDRTAWILANLVSMEGYLRLG